MVREFSVVIVEDNDCAAVSLADLLTRFGKENNIDFIIDRVRSAEKLLENYTPHYDICFMDIELPGKDGMSAAKRLRMYDSNIVLIFVTNMRQYAIAGYEVGALNYLIKPVNYNGLSSTMRRAIKIIEKSRPVCLSIKVEGGIRVIDSTDIMYIDVMNHDVIIHLNDESIGTYGTLSAFEKQLQGSGFARCSACTLVNMKYVRSVIRDDVCLKDDVIHISRKYKAGFMKELTVYLGEMK